MIGIYVTNLRAYNENELNGMWIDLPCVALREKIEALTWNEYNQCHDDYAIHDYEAPFGIKEYADVYELNRIAMALEEVKERFSETEIVSLLEAMDIDELLECYEDLEIIEGDNYEDLAYHLVDELGLFDKSPEFLKNYFDYEAYGRDLVLNGEYIQVSGYFVRTPEVGISPLFLLLANHQKKNLRIFPKVLSWHQKDKSASLKAVGCCCGGIH